MKFRTWLASLLLGTIAGCSSIVRPTPPDGSRADHHDATDTPPVGPIDAPPDEPIDAPSDDSRAASLEDRRESRDGAEAMDTVLDVSSADVGALTDAAAAKPDLALDDGPRACEAAAPLPLPSVLSGSIFARGELPFNTVDCGRPQRLAARFYRVEVPARGALVVEATGAAVVLIERCELSRCLSAPSFDLLPRLRWVNERDAPTTRIVALVRTDSSVYVPVSVTLSATVLSPDALCASAPTLSPSEGVMLARRSPPWTPTLFVHCGPGSSTTGSHFYALDVPPRSIARVEAPPGWSVALVPRCDRATCLGAASPGWGVDPPSARWFNESDATARVVVVAGTLIAADPGPLRATIHPYAPSARCETAPRLTEAPQEVATGLGVEGTTCTHPSPRPLPVSWWRAPVPRGRQVRVSVESPHERGEIFIASSCAATVCLSGTSLLRGERTEVVAINEGTAEELSVQLTAHETPLRLWITLEDPPPNRRCAAATLLAMDVELTSQRLAVSGDWPRPCAPIQRSVAGVYYRVEVPARARLRVTARAAVPVTLRLYETCEQLSCPGASALTPTPELRWTNPSDLPVTRFVAVSAASHPTARERESFSIRASLETDPDAGS